MHGGVNITGFKFLTKKHWDVAVTKELKKKNTVEQNYTMSVIFRHTYMINMFLKRYFYMVFFNLHGGLVYYSFSINNYIDNLIKKRSTYIIQNKSEPTIYVNYKSTVLSFLLTCLP